MRNDNDQLRRWLAILFFAGLLAAGTHPTQAETCIPEITSSSDYSPELAAAAASDCVTLWSGTLAVTNTPATILVESDINLTNNYKANLQAGLIEADQALVKIRGTAETGPKLGSKIVVVVTRQNDGESYAVAEGTDSRSPCYFTVMPDSYKTTVGIRQVKITIAHELFHCVQNAEVNTSVLNAGVQPDDTDTNGWWAEASAEWFGILAQPDFERTELAKYYELQANLNPHNVFDLYGWPFFAWYSEKHGAPEVLPFLNGLPQTVHKRQVIVKILDHDEWADYAKEYSSFSIWMTDLGRVNPAGRGARETQPIATDGDYAVNMNVAHLVRKSLEFEAGHWKISPTESNPIPKAFLSSTKLNGDPVGDWQELSSSVEIRTPCGLNQTYVVVGFGSEDTDQVFRFKVEKLDDECEAVCANIPAGKDQCLIGMWADHKSYPELTQLYTKLLMEPPTFSFYPDGTFTFDNPYWGRVDGGSGSRIVRYVLNRSIGFWGTSSSSLATCEKREEARGIYTKFVAGTRFQSSLNADKIIDPYREGEYSFRCEGDTVILNAPKMGIRDGVLKRIAGEEDFAPP